MFNHVADQCLGLMGIEIIHHKNMFRRRVQIHHVADMLRKIGFAVRVG